MRNFRRGLRYQKEKCSAALEAATARGDTSEAAEFRHRLDWIIKKQWFLDVKHEFVTDRPSLQSGRKLQYGSLEADARCSLTEQQIAWNAEMVIQELTATAVPRG